MSGVGWDYYEAFSQNYLFSVVMYIYVTLPVIKVKIKIQFLNFFYIVILCFLAIPCCYYALYIIVT